MSKKEWNEILNRARAAESFAYMFLDRLRSDCKYYLNYGHRNPSVLWAGEETAHINMMKELHNAFKESDKPEWLTMKDILNFEKEMVKGKE